MSVAVQTFRRAKFICLTINHTYDMYSATKRTGAGLECFSSNV